MKLSRFFRPTGLNMIIYLSIFVFGLLILLSIWNMAGMITDHDRSSLKFHTSVIRMKSDVYLDLKEDIFKNDDILLQKLQRNKSVYVSLRSFVVLSIIIAVLWQLKTLISSFTADTFFNPRNIRCVRRISYLLMTWILADIIFYLCIPLFIPLSAVGETYNFWPINGDSWNITVGIFTFLGSINYGVLLSAFAFYVISIVFREGNVLKQQADLTI
jgi:hypothetical protein